jgi:hypothetical protein
MAKGNRFRGVVFSASLISAPSYKLSRLGFPHLELTNSDFQHRTTSYYIMTAQTSGQGFPQNATDVQPPAPAIQPQVLNNDAYDRLSAKIDNLIASQSRQSKRVQAANDITQKGNRINFKYNCNLLNINDSAQYALDIKDYDAVADSIRESNAAINYRNKLISMADDSDLGWGLVAHYESHAQANDSDDGARIRRADTSACAAKKRKFEEKSGKGKQTARSENYRAQQAVTPEAPTQVQQAPAAATAGHFQPAGNASAPKNPPKCYFCDVFGHTRTNCPALKHVLLLAGPK